MIAHITRCRMYFYLADWDSIPDTQIHITTLDLINI